ncbi:zinc metalloproteinase nas-13-like [Brevipalpus obovatus]|uniref:zinc metalloproteinase nas-13-like n=1 Tax=Brevipalpus obovatus TaxID=246614 RepID=UPI003D9E90F3
MAVVEKEIFSHILIICALMSELIGESLAVERRAGIRSPVHGTTEFSESSDDDETFLDEADFENAENVDVNDMRGFNLSLLDNEGAIEGDIMPPDYQPRAKNSNKPKYKQILWPKSRIPYAIDPHYDKKSRATIAKAMKLFESETCIKFVKKQKNDKDYVFIKPEGKGCSSYFGRKGGKQIVSLVDGCTFVGIVQHELMHTLGFPHEQSRLDRDKFIKIFSNRTKSGAKLELRKIRVKGIDIKKFRYDVGSVMHSSSWVFSPGLGPTIVAKNGTKIPQAKQASNGDIKRINSLYNCKR